jgi:hypothetical protein
MTPAADMRLYVNGAGLWSQRLPGWERARRILAGLEPAPAEDSPRPAPQLLPPNERRRAPDTVAVALEAALAACHGAEVSPASLPSVFSSMYGDLAITDYMCTTLAATPMQVSPTRFHNSVHNAAAGYWTIAAECMRPYTALSAGECSFGAGLLEACVQACAGGEDVLLVAYDIDARGPIAAVAPSRHLLATALVVSPRRGSRAIAQFDLGLVTGPDVAPSRARDANLALVAGNGSQQCLPFMEALALEGHARRISCLAGPSLALEIELRAA